MNKPSYRKPSLRRAEGLAAVTAVMKPISGKTKTIS